MKHLCETPLTIALLYPGEMGAALAILLRSRGHVVISPVAERSVSTKERCREAEIEVSASLADAIAASDLVISVIHPAGAVAMAEEVVAALPTSGARPIYLDLNSVSPMTAEAMHQVLETAGLRFCSAVIHGLASRLQQDARLYVSGPAAPEIAAIFAPIVGVVTLGSGISDAKAMKMLLGGFTKLLAALTIELSSVAKTNKLTDGFAEAMQHHYGEIVPVLSRLLPTYLRHAQRRSTELNEVAQWMQSSGMCGDLFQVGSRTLERLADQIHDGMKPDNCLQDESLAETLSSIALDGQRCQNSMSTGTARV